MEETRYYEDYDSHGNLQEEAMQDAAESQLVAVEKAMISVSRACESVEEAANLVNERQDEAQHRIRDINGHFRKRREKIPQEEFLESLKGDFEALQEGWEKFLDRCREFLEGASRLAELERGSEEEGE